MRARFLLVQKESEFLLGIKRLTERSVLDALNKLGRPVTASELGEQLDASGQVMGAHLYRLARRGAALKITSGRVARWVGDDELMRGLVQAFPVLIAFYERRNPSHARYLEAEWDHLLERGFAQWEV